jgi:hypothetical protein
MTAAVTQHTLLALQVCVPTDWTDEQVKTFAEAECPCGTSSGWLMRKTGDANLAGYPERVACEDRDGHVHIMFDA